MEIIECVPNISEGRNSSKIKKLLNAVSSTEKIKLLHHTSDRDHNRTVITYIGNIDSIFTATLSLLKEAKKILNLQNHHGIHPRFGIVDVIPFILLKGDDKTKLIKKVRQFGEVIKNELKIPALFYEQATENLEEKNLADLRRKLKETQILKKYPTHGVSSISVREILIAFNINLNSSDLKLAQKIASEIREKNGGLPFVKALGLELKSQNCTQISMNLTNYKITPPQLVFQTIKNLTKNFGIEIIESEIIGMIPKEIITPNFKKNLKAINFQDNQILDLENISLS